MLRGERVAAAFEARAVATHGVGKNVLVFCECADGRSPIAYLVERDALTDEQWERLKGEAERWARELSTPPARLQII